MTGKRTAAIIMVFALLCALTLPASADDAIHISTAEQLCEFAVNCTLDTYSEGVSVVLDNDIDLAGVEFYPIPTFSGSFDGGGHTIYNMTTATDGSHQGMFRYIQAGGKISRLNVTGSVVPGSSRSIVGGIAGTNYGTISQCSFDGTVEGMNRVGGIAGENYGSILSCTVNGKISGKRFTGAISGYSTGLISGCTGYAQVNTSISEGGLELDSLNLADMVNPELTSAEDTNVVSDTGGIVGYSSGSVISCANRGTVGYPHYGYNVGGIAGRQSGYVNLCTNYGEIYGRKDVGGIVGQMEPYLQLKAAVSISGELYTLQELTAKAMGNLSGMSQQVKDVLTEINNSSSSASDKINNSSGATEPGTADQGTTEPGTANQGTTEPGTADQGTTEPGTTDQGTTESGTTDQGTTEPGTTDQGTAEPGTTDQGTTEPGTANQGTTEPGTADQGTTEPGTADQGTTEPGTDEPGGIELPQLPSMTLPDGISGDLDNMANGMNQLAGIMSDSTGNLARDLVDVSNQLSRVLMLMANALSGKDMTVYEDVSETLSADDTEGRVSKCVNYGAVDADINVGGVAGAMGIEYEFDMEGILSQTLGIGNIISSTYLTKCVASDDMNRGAICAKKDNTGGIIGLADVGTIYSCEGYGSVHSTEGSCVGGIVGRSNTSVRDSYAMCSVDGTEYVGGIAGYGSKISGCATLIGVGDVTACCGAVAGWADMTVPGAVTDNIYVHERLGAVDGISYAGKAAAVSYEQLLEKDGLPISFRRLKLSFTADGQLVKELDFYYGGDLDESRIPAVPEKEGYSGRWQDYDYTNLRFSDTIEAVYTPRQAAVAVNRQRGDSPMSILLLEGDFEDGTKVSLNEYTGEGPELESGSVLEKWVLKIENTQTPDRYSVRYLAPEASDGDAAVYLYSDGAWSRVNTGRSGSYMTFDCAGDTVVFCAVKIEHDNSAAIAAGIGAAAAAAALSAVVIRRRKAKNKAESAEK